MKLEFIKLRGRPKKRITMSYTEMIWLQKNGMVKITGYLVKMEKQDGTT